MCMYIPIHAGHIDINIIISTLLSVRKIHLRNKRKNLKWCFASLSHPATKSTCINARRIAQFCLHGRALTKVLSVKTENAPNVYCLPLVRRCSVFGREICFYICTYRRKYWWPRCENKLSRRENNSMFNCCIAVAGHIHRCNFAQERRPRAVYLSVYIYIYYLIICSCTF